jgi:hypothetical protein
MRNILRLLFIFALLITSLNTTFEVTNPAESEHQYPSGPWGLGVVVPENARFSDGGHLSWGNATAVSITIRLPNMSFTDYPTLAVESVMAADGSVMQVAAGIYPNYTTWLAYAWYIQHVQAYPQTYEWVLNSSRPEMSADAPVSLSIYLSLGRWQYRIEDLSTHQAAAGDYAFNVPPTLKVGDQEVFAFESYSTSNVVFAHMGNLTLDRLSINGRQIQADWYGYGSWDTHHNPLFTVGGRNPPSYISMQEEKHATFVWSYHEWLGSGQAPPQRSPLTILVSVPTLAAIAVVAVLYTMRRHTKISADQRNGQQHCNI